VELSGTGSIADRIWAKPALSVIGIDAPTVAESANILVHRARAKISLSLAPGQDPKAALDALREHQHCHAEFGAHVTVSDGALGAPCVLETDTPAYAAAEQAFGEAFGQTPVQIGVGGSSPFIAEFAELFPDATVLVTGVEDPDSRANGVDESLHLGQFAKVCLAETLLLARLAELPR
jgi:cysteinylglycine-S-conjugate dipeptidase